MLRLKTLRPRATKSAEFVLDDDRFSRVKLIISLICSIFLVLGFGACSAKGNGPVTEVFTVDSNKILVVDHGYHSGIAIPTQVLDGQLELEQFKDYQTGWLEFGWGDRSYYQNPDTNFLDALNALFIPGRAVLHVAHLPPDFNKILPTRSIVELDVPSRDVAALVNYIADYFEVQDPAVPPTALQTGLYGKSYFYAAKGRFHFARNCNDWVAQALREAGYPFGRSLIRTSRTVVSEARRLKAGLP